MFIDCHEIKPQDKHTKTILTIICTQYDVTKSNPTFYIHLIQLYLALVSRKN